MRKRGVPGPYFQLVRGEPDNSEAGRMKEAFRALEEKVARIG